MGWDASTYHCTVACGFLPSIILLHAGVRASAGAKARFTPRRFVSRRRRRCSATLQRRGRPPPPSCSSFSSFASMARRCRSTRLSISGSNATSVAVLAIYIMYIYAYVARRRQPEKGGTDAGKRQYQKARVCAHLYFRHRNSRRSKLVVVPVSSVVCRLSAADCCRTADWQRTDEHASTQTAERNVLSCLYITRTKCDIAVFFAPPGARCHYVRHFRALCVSAHLRRFGDDVAQTELSTAGSVAAAAAVSHRQHQSPADHLSLVWQNDADRRNEFAPRTRDRHSAKAAKALSECKFIKYTFGMGQPTDEAAAPAVARW